MQDFYVLMNRRMRATTHLVLTITLALIMIGTSGAASAEKNNFRSAWAGYEGRREWIGKEYWANRLGDWEIRNGRLERKQRVNNKRLIVKFGG